ncbi:MAG: exo-alpha-sialidase, partial [Clostridia bacterium]|nr:exo-alpha-sialidase [Clostridia bacterium]
MELIHDFAPSASNPRNSEGSFYRRKDGKILFFYSKFVGGYDDFSTSVIAVATFSEDGKTLLPGERILFHTSDFGEDAQNVMCTSCFPLTNGDLALFFLVR